MSNPMIVNTGLALISNLLKGGTNAYPQYIGWGTGATAPASGDTQLGNERSETRVAGTMSQATTTTANDTFKVVGVLTCAGTTATITEVGLFDTSGTGTGNMLMRGTFTGIALSVGDSIQFTINNVITSG